MVGRIIKEKFRLFLSWKAAIYISGGISAVLSNVELTGPVVPEIEKMSDNDGISLDLSFQYVEAMGSWSIARLSWGTVISQTAERILLGDCILVSPELTKTELLSDVDKLLIDTENHQPEKHPFHLVYPAIMVNRDGVPYKYEGV